MTRMIDIIDISNDPITGKNRKLLFLGLDDLIIPEYTSSFVSNLSPVLELRFQIAIYNEDGNIFISDRVMNPYQRSLIIDNSTSVDNQGNYVSYDSADRVSGEYDFIKNALILGANIINLINTGVERADILKRFD